MCYNTESRKLFEKFSWRAMTLAAAPEPSGPESRQEAVRRLVADHIADRSPKGIAAAVHRLIRAGRLDSGDRLPTVRELAGDLGVSPATVSEAWQALGAVGAIQARGRAGTFVKQTIEPSLPTRYLGIGAAPGADGLDLSTGTPDPALLPSLREALERVTTRSLAWTTSYLDDPVLPQLASLLLDTWPFEPTRLTVVDGALDAMSRIVDQVVRLGDRVVMENPGFPPLIDLLERSGAEIVPVGLDDEGIIPGELAAALELAPVAIFLQPRAQNPTGTNMTTGRCRQLAALVAGHADLTGHEPWIIEDDHSGDIATGEDVSIGRFLPERTIHIRSYSKSHGPDLRIAAVGGAADVIDPLVARRMLGPGWTSRLLQAVLVELLTDPASVAAVLRARTAYAVRSLALRAGLAGHGITSSMGDGINAWVKVADERSALITLAARGVRVAPGTPFEITPTRGHHVRVTTGLLDEDDPAQLQDVLAALVAAANAGPTLRGV
jgi:DNA-binding transcriptional MocR family regulator